MYTSSADLPWPVPDPRARHWAGQFSDMRTIVEPLKIPQSLPVNVQRLFETCRELLRFSYYHLEFGPAAVYTSITAVEAALRERYQGRNLNEMIGTALADGTLTAEQADRLHAGRQIRNRYSHGRTMHPAMAIPFAVQLVVVALEVVALLDTSDSGEDVGTHPA
ncbi:hypothetical protein ACG5V6_24220 [Streptomyces chitinivorans]|uniref:DUF4145 domain-containing protein n=1 Tax=Streptomyces chitinivorans TaxID=1257027 RepID=A0ABW7HZH9_9ACTN|nr:hypothetical protein [Streptomyces chitinivorans]MDH2412368.1 hypothetical protein [Streptomyces chitinivorans]